MAQALVARITVGAMQNVVAIAEAPAKSVAEI
jgi:hypothetical protein